MQHNIPTDLSFNVSTSCIPTWSCSVTSNLWLTVIALVDIPIVLKRPAGTVSLIRLVFVSGERTIFHPSQPLTATFQAVNKASQAFLTTPLGEIDLLCRPVKMFYSPSLSTFPPLHPFSPSLVCDHDPAGAFDPSRETRVASKALVRVWCSKMCPDVRWQVCSCGPTASFGFCSASLSHDILVEYHQHCSYNQAI